jgi:ATP-binding cassette, subfamily B, bacterial
MNRKFKVQSSKFKEGGRDGRGGFGGPSSTGRRCRPTTVIIRLIRFSPGYFSLCVLFAIIVYLCVPLPLGLVTQAFFDAVGGGRAGLNAWSAIAILVAIQIGEAVAGPLLGNPWSPMQQKSHVLLRRNLFAGILRGYGRHGLPVSSGEIVSRFRDDPVIIADALDALCDLIGRSIFAIVAAVLMWRISPIITVALFVPLLLCSFLTELLGARIMAYRTASRAASGVLTGFLGDLLGAQLAVNVAGATPHAIGRLTELGHARRRAEVRDSVFGGLLDALSVNLGSLGTGVVLLLGAQAMRAGTFTVGDLALFVVFLDALGWLPEEIGRLIGGLKRIEVSYGRMNAIIPGQPPAGLAASAPVYLRGTLPDLPTPKGYPPPARERLERLEVQGLTYAHPTPEGYPGSGGIVDVSFTVERGSLTVVTGRIGAGKTTLLKVLLGLLPRDGGEIRWNGRRVDDPATFLVPPRSAYTPQAPRLFSETLRENLLLGWPAGEAALERAIHAAVLGPDIAALGNGLDSPIGPRGVKLSGGQVQRAAAARMFVREAELLVFDDLSSALDAETEAELWRRLFARGRDQTCLVVSHRPAVLRRADQVLVMGRGRVVAQGTPDEVLGDTSAVQGRW